MTSYRVAILTVSDTASVDVRLDHSGPLIREILTARSRYDIVAAEVVPDSKDTIVGWVRSTIASHDADWIITTGGTGFGQRDCTPEAISSIIERPAPGLVHLLLSTSLQKTPMASLSRLVAGISGNTLVVTLPGSPKAVSECLDPLLGVIGHALDLLRGESGAAVHKALGVPARGDTEAGGTVPLVLDGLRPAHALHGDCDSVTSAVTGSGCLHHSSDNHHAKAVPRGEILSHDPTASLARRHRISPWPLLPFQVALDTVLEHCAPLDTALLPVDPSLCGHVLAEDVFAVNDVPASATTNVDGYALLSSQGPGTYRVVTATSHDLATPLPAGTIMRVNTGAPIPKGSDAVIMVEDTQVASTQPVPPSSQEEEETVSTLAAVVSGENVRKPASDVSKGSKVLKRGTIIAPEGGEVGTLAFIGVKQVQVFNKPVVAIMSTGNELVDIRQGAANVPSTEQWAGIPDTNRPSLQAALEGLGYKVVDLGIVPDTVGDHERVIRDGLSSADILVTTGGSSMGATDLLKPVIERSLGGNIRFGRVAIKPGKPTTFATISYEDSGATREKPLFALPGNPVSALVMFWIFVLPALRRLGGFPLDRCSLARIQVRLEDDMHLDPRPEFHRVVVRCTNAGLAAFSTGGQRSSRMSSLAGANAFIALPARTESVNVIRKGQFADAVLFGELRT